MASGGGAGDGEEEARRRRGRGEEQARRRRGRGEEEARKRGGGGEEETRRRRGRRQRRKREDFENGRGDGPGSKIPRGGGLGVAGWARRARRGVGRWRGGWGRRGEEEARSRRGGGACLMISLKNPRAEKRLYPWALQTSLSREEPKEQPPTTQRTPRSVPRILRAPPRLSYPMASLPRT